MKTAKRTLMFLACAAAIPVFAQNSSDSRCGLTNYDKDRNMFTIVHPIPGAVNEQCFITVVPKEMWHGGMPDPASSKFVEGNYRITLSGGGAGGGGGTHYGGGGGGGGAIPITVVRYLKPGIYRLTIGAGGQGGAPKSDGAVGAPTSLADAVSGRTVAGYAGADTWNGTYPASDPSHEGESQGGAGAVIDHSTSKGHDGGHLIAVAYTGVPGTGGTDLDGHMLLPHEVGGGGGGEGVAEAGAAGGNGFIRVALTDPPPKAPTPTAAGPANVAPAAPALKMEMPPARPPRVDRN